MMIRDKNNKPIRDGDWILLSWTDKRTSRTSKLYKIDSIPPDKYFGNPIKMPTFIGVMVDNELLYINFAHAERLPRQKFKRRAYLTLLKLNDENIIGMENA